MANPLNAVSKQWDPAVTAFSTLDRLRGLAVATSQDDVQLGAVVRLGPFRFRTETLITDPVQLAIERLGACLIVSDGLISDAVGALKGNESVRLADARLLLGLAWGGVASQIRLSTACVRAFLLITAVKACAYEESEVAEILYNYLSAAKLLDPVPVCCRQLQSLIGVLSEYSEALLRSVQRTMDNVIQVIADQENEDQKDEFGNSRSGSYFNSLRTGEIAELFRRCFEAIQSDEGGFIEISGDRGLIWIATVLLWFNFEDVGLFSRETCLLGAVQGKVRIIMDKKDFSEWGGEWAFESWRVGESIRSLISPIGSDDSFDFEPFEYRKKKFVKMQTRNSFVDLEGSNGITITIGSIAAGLVDAALHFGRLNRSSDSKEQVEFLPLRLLYERPFIEKGGRVMEEYGWHTG